jgi:hypothetical protein
MLNKQRVVNAGSTKVYLHFFFHLPTLSPIHIFPQKNMGDAQNTFGPSNYGPLWVCNGS